MVTTMEGPLAPWASGLAGELDRLGYARRSAATLLQLAGGLSRRLEQRGLGVGDLTVEVVEEFLGSVRAKGGSFQPTAKSLAWLVGFFIGAGVTPAPAVVAPSSPQDELVERFRCHLVVERGLAAGSVEPRVRAARLFLGEHPSGQLAGLGAAEVAMFMTRHCPLVGVGSAKLLATALRSFLAFAQLEGLIAAPLAAAVPSAAGWSGAALPRGLAPGQVKVLLASCDRARATGIRDYAILVVLVRLGLRAAEVAALRLDDIDWHGGDIVVRGKGRSEERLPLPVDVGAAIVDYLRHGRPVRSERAVFLRAHAPLRGLSCDGVGEVVRAASERAQLGSFGPHRLRHTAATEMLRAGATLPEVAQVLRQRSAATTAIYAKVDRIALGALVQPWPGCER